MSGFPVASDPRATVSLAYGPVECDYLMASCVAPAERALLDEMPRHIGEWRRHRERAEKHLPPRRLPVRQPRDQILRRPTVDVEPVREIADMARIIEPTIVPGRKADDEISAGQREQHDQRMEPREQHQCRQTGDDKRPAKAQPVAQEVHCHARGEEAEEPGHLPEIAEWLQRLL